jgi:hypothetical protein
VVSGAVSKRLGARWVAGSLVLHAALLGLAHFQRAPAALVAAQRTTAQQPELDVELEPASEAEPAPEPERASPPSLARTPAGAHRTALHVAPTTADVSSAEASAAAELGDLALSGADASTEGHGATAPGPRLSLTELGVGERNPFVDRRGEQQEQAAKARAVQRRLDRALAQGLLDQDSARGHGAGSPVMRILEAATYASATSANSTASFTFMIDGEGKVRSGVLGHVSSDREAWERVARQAVRDLAQHKLRVPKGGKGVKLTVQVTSRLELPSGTAARVDVSEPLNPLAPLSLVGDLADLGANARRMVRARVISEEVL